MMSDKELQAIKDDLPNACKMEAEILDAPWRKEDEEQSFAPTDEDTKMASSMLEPRFLSDKSINAATVVPRRVGEKFTKEQEEWLTRRFDLRKAYGGKTGLRTYSIDEVSEAFAALPWELSTGEQKALDAQQKRDAEDKARKEERAKAIKASDARTWVEENFKNADINDYNKRALLDFLDGNKKKFEGMVTWKWSDPLERLGVLAEADSNGRRDILWDKLKEVYEAQKAPERPHCRAAGQAQGGAGAL